MSSEAHAIARDSQGLARLYFLSFVTGLSGALMPGPLLVSAIEQTSVQGMTAILGLITGHALLELAIVALLVLGLQTVIARPRVRGSIGILGGVALLYMGADMLHAAFGTSLRLQADAVPAYTFGKLMLLGVLISLANPYFTGWWATIGAGQLAYIAPRTVPEYASFYFGHETADYLWYGLVGVLVITGRRWLSDQFFHGLIIGCAVVLLLLGLRFLLVGFRLVGSPAPVQSAS